MVMRVQIPSPAPTPQAVEEAREAGFVCGLFSLDTRGSVIRSSAAGCQCRNPSPAPMQDVQSRTDEPGEYRRNASWLRNDTDRSSAKGQFGWQHGTDGHTAEAQMLGKRGKASIVNTVGRMSNPAESRPSCFRSSTVERLIRTQQTVVRFHSEAPRWYSSDGRAAVLYSAGRGFDSSYQLHISGQDIRLNTSQGVKIVWEASNRNGGSSPPTLAGSQPVNSGTLELTVGQRTEERPYKADYRGE